MLLRVEAVAMCVYVFVYVCVCGGSGGQIVKARKTSSDHEAVLLTGTGILKISFVCSSEKANIGWIPSFLLPPSLDWVPTIHQFFTRYCLIKSGKDVIPALRRQTYW